MEKLTFGEWTMEKYAWKLRNNSSFYRIVMTGIKMALATMAGDAKKEGPILYVETAQNWIENFKRIYLSWKYTYKIHETEIVKEDDDIVEYGGWNPFIEEKEENYNLAWEVSKAITESKDWIWVMATIEHALRLALFNILDGRTNSRYYQDKMFINSFFEDSSYWPVIENL